jgi:hypothetical protein
MRRNPQADWCEAPRGGGSHYMVFHRRIDHIMTVPFKRPIKPAYIRRVVRFLPNAALSELLAKGCFKRGGEARNCVSAEDVYIEVRPSADPNRLIVALELPGAAEQLECVVKKADLLSIRMVED